MAVSACDTVVIGTCVMLADGRITYAGPIKGAPSTSGMLVLLNPADFVKFKKVAERHRH